MLLRHLAMTAGMGLLVWLAAACSSEPTAPAGTPQAHVAQPQQAAVTLQPTAEASATPAPTATVGMLQIETPTASPTPTETPLPTEPPPCTNNLAFVSDVTVPDGTQFLPGQPIDKQWRVRNSGDCDWGSDYRVVLVSGNGMGPRSELALFPARAGAEAVIRIEMQAPSEPGDYRGRWQARSPEGRLFGNIFFIDIVVIPLPEEPQPEGGE
jgi:hypothetical protein